MQFTVIKSTAVRLGGADMGATVPMDPSLALKIAASFRDYNQATVDPTPTLIAMGLPVTFTLPQSASPNAAIRIVDTGAAPGVAPRFNLVRSQTFQIVGMGAQTPVGLVPFDGIEVIGFDAFRGGGVPVGLAQTGWITTPPNTSSVSNANVFNPVPRTVDFPFANSNNDTGVVTGLTVPRYYIQGTKAMGSMQGITEVKSNVLIGSVSSVNYSNLVTIDPAMIPTFVGVVLDVFVLEIDDVLLTSASSLGNKLYLASAYAFQSVDVEFLNDVGSSTNVFCAVNVNRSVDIAQPLTCLSLSDLSLTGQTITVNNAPVAFTIPNAAGITASQIDSFISILPGDQLDNVYPSFT